MLTCCPTYLPASAYAAILLVCAYILCFAPILQAHMCFKKAAMVCGVQHVRILRASEQRDFGLDPETLAAAVQEDLQAGLIPFYLCGTIGTTSSCAVDPMAELAAVCKQ